MSETTQTIEQDLPQSILSKGNEALVFLIAAAAWLLFLTSTDHFLARPWYNYLFYGRLFLTLLGIICGALVYFLQYRNLASTYFIVCAAFQSSMAALEEHSEIQFYEYVAYFFLLSALTFHGSFGKWARRPLPILLAAEIIPLLFKDIRLFSTPSALMYNFTTTVVVIFVANVIVKVSAGRYSALLDNINLKARLLDIKEHQKQLIEAELGLAKARIVEASRSEAIADLSRQVSHDIRSPLSALNLMVSSIEDMTPDKRMLIGAAVNRINGIANQLLSLSKAGGTVQISSDSRPTPPEAPQHVHLGEFLTSIISEKRIQYSELQNVEFALHCPAVDLYCCIDQIELSRALSNVFDNAVEATCSSGRIQAELAVQGDMAIITISDNGLGIPADILSKIGQKGVTFGKGGRGSGLGLFHAKETITRAGGSLNLTSSPGKGTSVTFQIPIVK